MVRRTIHFRVDIQLDPEGVLLVLFIMGDLGEPFLVSCKLLDIAVHPPEPEPEP